MDTNVCESEFQSLCCAGISSNILTAPIMKTCVSLELVPTVDFKVLAWSKILPHVINARTSGILFSTFEKASIFFTNALESLWTVSLHLGSGSCLMITNCCPCKLHSDWGYSHRLPEASASSL
jgi:hypothetical protein